MASTQNRVQLTLPEISRNFNDTLAQADDDRAAQLDDLAVLRTNRATQLQREKVRLAALTEPNHPYLATLDNRLQLNAGLVQNLNTAAAQARTNLPDVPDNTWVLHGRVYTAQNQPVSGVRVSLSESSTQASSSVTDEKGYFLINVVIGKNLPAAVSIAVTDGKTFLYRDSVQMTPTAGATTYRDIFLPDVPPPPPPPPPKTPPPPTTPPPPPPPPTPPPPTPPPPKGPGKDGDDDDDDKPKDKDKDKDGDKDRDRDKDDDKGKGGTKDTPPPKGKPGKS